MARKNEAGRPWARIAAAAVAGLNVAGAASVPSVTDDVGAIALNALDALLGVVIVVLLYRPTSSRWFRPGA
jgi:hypothetical protein